MVSKRVLLVKGLGFTEKYVEEIIQEHSSLMVLDRFESSSELGGRDVKYDLILVEEGEGRKGIEVLKRVMDNWPDTPIIYVTPYSDVNNYLEVMNLGAYDYLTHPDELNRLPSLLNKVLFGE